MTPTPDRTGMLAAIVGTAVLVLVLAGTSEITSATAASSPAAGERMTASDRLRIQPWSDEKARIEGSLPIGHDRAFYGEALSQLGYRITAINIDKPDEVEFEIVRDHNTYEVQIQFDAAGASATQVDVVSNLWRTESTKSALRGAETPVAARVVPTIEAYLDRLRMQRWSTEKDKLQKALAIGNERAYYAERLRQLDYRITSTNRDEPDYLEFEVVRGTDTYEVQVKFKNGKASEVKVAANMWTTEATERALLDARH